MCFLQNPVVRPPLWRPFLRMPRISCRQSRLRNASTTRSKSRRERKTSLTSFRQGPGRYTKTQQFQQAHILSISYSSHRYPLTILAEPLSLHVRFWLPLKVCIQTLKLLPFKKKKLYRSKSPSIYRTNYHKSSAQWTPGYFERKYDFKMALWTS